MIFIHHKGEQLKGEPGKLIGYCEANGYTFERNNQHAEAHSIWQLGEYIKRELDGRKDSAIDRPKRARKNHNGDNRNYGRRTKPEHDSGEAAPDTGEGRRQARKDSQAAEEYAE